MQSQDVKTSLYQNARFIAMATVLQKLLLFVLNQTILANTSPELLGKVSIQLELWLSTSLFLSREGVRLACLRYPLKTGEQVQNLLSTSLLPSFAVLLVSGTFFLLRLLWWKIPIWEESNQLLVLYSLAAWIESLSEPCYNLFQNQLYVTARLTGETLSLLGKSIATFIFLTYFNCGIYSFAFAQVLYAAVYSCSLFCYWTTFLRTKQNEEKESQLFLQVSSFLQVGAFDRSLILSSLQITISSVFKHFITEADKIVLTMTCTAREQGVYALTNNYGSLIARMIYLPMEDSSRMSFAKLAADSRQVNGELSIEGLLELRQLLVQMLQLALFVGTTIATFGPPFVHVLFEIILSSQWKDSDASRALAIFCYYLLLMGVNGIAEAFVQSAAPAKDFFWLNVGLLLSSGTFVLTAWTTVTTHGTIAIVFANILAVLLRLIWNFLYIDRFFRNSKINGKTLVLDVIPSLYWAVLPLITHALLFAVRGRYSSWLSSKQLSTVLFLAFGAVVGLLYLICGYFLLDQNQQLWVSSILGRFKRSSKKQD